MLYKLMSRVFYFPPLNASLIIGYSLVESLYDSDSALVGKSERERERERERRTLL